MAATDGTGCRGHWSSRCAAPGHVFSSDSPAGAGKPAMRASRWPGPKRRPGARPRPSLPRRLPCRANRCPAEPSPSSASLCDMANCRTERQRWPVDTGDHRQTGSRHRVPRHHRTVRYRTGASVRLVGDDQQLAAIGAGGVLRDIQHIHDAIRLTELHRFTDPAEAAASLALREGDPSAGFYLDQGRVHVGDVATTTEDAFSAWVSDRAAGFDSIMLAPTRHLVAELNRRARARLSTTPQPRSRCVSPTATWPVSGR